MVGVLCPVTGYYLKKAVCINRLLFALIGGLVLCKYHKFVINKFFNAQIT